jgi:hypothetical protein
MVGPPFGEAFGDNRSFRTTGVALIAVCMLAIASATIGAAATKEDIAHCRAIEQLPERLGCFKSLKRAARPKMEHAPIKHETINPNTDDPGRSPPSNDPASSGSIDHLTLRPADLYVRIAMHSPRWCLRGCLLQTQRKQLRSGVNQFPMTPDSRF